ACGHTAQLVGSGTTAHSTDMQILPWAIGDDNATGSGTDFVTIDSGAIRRLASDEYGSLTPSNASPRNALVSSDASVSSSGLVNSIKMTGSSRSITINGGNTIATNAILDLAGGSSTI